MWEPGKGRVGIAAGGLHMIAFGFFPSQPSKMSHASGLGPSDSGEDSAEDVIRRAGATAAVSACARLVLRLWIWIDGLAPLPCLRRLLLGGGDGLVSDADSAEGGVDEDMAARMD